jgi:hypothetical protein
MGLLEDRSDRPGLLGRDRREDRRDDRGDRREDRRDDRGDRREDRRDRRPGPGLLRWSDGSRWGVAHSNPSRLHGDAGISGACRD